MADSLCRTALCLLTGFFLRVATAHADPLPPTGRPVAWGADIPARNDTPSNLLDAIGIVAQANYCLAIRLDGTVVAWGDLGEVTPPAGLSSVRALAAGESHAVALQQNGTVIAWGNNDYGQSSVPPALGPAVIVAAGAYHTLALRADGTLVGWGNNGDGQATPPGGLAGVTALAAGLTHSAALRGDGSVVVWGDNGYGQTNVPDGMSGVFAIAAGRFHTLALKLDGTVTAWGDDSAGQTDVPETLTDVIAIAAGAFHSLALKQDGTVVAWGEDGSGQAEVPADLGGVIALAAGASHSAALVRTPVITSQPSDQAAYAGEGAAFAVVATGDSPLHYQWRRNGVDLIGATSATLQITHVQPADVGTYSVRVDGRFSSVTSHSARLGLLGAPVILTQPVNLALETWRPAGFTVVASGTPPLTYQWRKEDQVLSGATGATCSLGPARAAHEGTYSVVVNNAEGSVTSVVTSLAVTGAHARRVVAGGNNSGGETVVPLALGGVTAIAAGGRHTVALLENATVVAWGRNGFGECTPPTDLDHVIAVAAGRFHSAALLEDSRVVAWGRNDDGQSSAPPTLEGVIGIAAGGSHSVALLQDGTVTAWGDNSEGQCSMPPNLHGVVALAAGESHTVALRIDGTVVAWGANADGQCTIPPGLTGVIAIAAGSFHTVGLKADGTVAAWGADSYRQASPPLELSGANMIAAGGYCSFALRADGTAAAWGDLSYGQRSILELNGLTAVAGGEFHFAALTLAPVLTAQPIGRTVGAGESMEFSVTAEGMEPLSYQWRKNGVAIDGATAPVLSFAAVLGPDTGDYDVIVSKSDGGVTGSVTSLVARLTVAVAPLLLAAPTNLFANAGSDATFQVEAIGAEPIHYQWRRNGIDILDATNQTYTILHAGALDAGEYSVEVTNPFGNLISLATLTVVIPPSIEIQPSSVSASAGQNAGLTVTAAGTLPLLYQWRKAGVDLPGATNRTLSLGKVQPEQAGDYTVEVSNAAGSVTSAVAALTVGPALTGSVVAWGANDAGQISVPPGLNDISAVAAGTAHTLALHGNGTVVAWGDNSEHQASVPSGLTQAIAIAAGTSHSLALRVGGAMVAWGEPGPQRVNASGIAAIAAGRFHTAALRLNGTVVVWGEGIFDETRVPEGLNAVAAIAAGGAHTLALRVDGTVVAWGGNWNGQADVPAGLTEVMAVAAGEAHSLALKADGTVVAWGDNRDGQTNVPPDLNAVIAIAAGGAHSVALKDDGTVVAWGRNGEGQAAPPVQLRGVMAISAGYSHTVALGTHPSIGAQPLNQTVRAGEDAAFSVSASSAGSIYYQWLKDGLFLSARTNALLTLAEVDVDDAGQYSVVVSNSFGSVTSEVATLTVLAEVAIRTQPQDQGALLGQSATFSVDALGAQPLIYQWYLNGERIAGANASSYTIANVHAADSGRYAVLVINGGGSLLSDDAQLTVLYPASIVRQPEDRVGVLGTTVTFSVQAGGTGPFAYQWFREGALIPEAAGPEYSFSAELDRAGGYQVVVSNAWGTATSLVARLVVAVPPEIVEQPQAQRAAEGWPARFSVRVSGSEPFQFEWKHDGVPIPGKNQAALELGAVSAAAAGRYSVRISNLAGSVLSAEAELTVILPPTLKLELLSGYPLLTLTGTPGENYVVEYAEQRQFSNWTTLIVFSNLAAGPRTFIDTSPATNLFRLYRVLDR
jgi:alpha-tubulin suppressor-like RCC1 family protein